MKKLFAFCVLFSVAAAFAQPFPAKPITVIVPFGPGGTTDLMARALQVEFEKAIGGPIIGFIADHFGARWSIASGGFAASAAGVLGLARGWRRGPSASDAAAGSEPVGFSAR